LPEFAWWEYVLWLFSFVGAFAAIVVMAPFKMGTLAEAHGGRRYGWDCLAACWWMWNYMDGISFDDCQESRRRATYRAMIRRMCSVTYVLPFAGCT